jgi:hypothetical protein
MASSGKNPIRVPIWGVEGTYFVPNNNVERQRFWIVTYHGHSYATCSADKGHDEDDDMLISLERPSPVHARLPKRQSALANGIPVY